MDPKRWLMICTVALMLTLSAGWRGSEASAADKDDHLGRVFPAEYAPAATAGQAKERTASDPFLELLGASSEEEVHDALYNDMTLADIAEANGQDPQALIDAQIGELKEQLRGRLISGSISWEQYQAYIAEVPELIAGSAYGLT